MNELTLPIVKKHLNSVQAKYLKQEHVDTLNKIAKDPEYGEEFVHIYIENMEAISSSSRFKQEHYINAVKFYTLLESGYNLTQSYMKVFPDRAERRREVNPETYEVVIRNEASRYNTSAIVNKIREFSSQPVKLLFRHVLLEAIETQAKLMRNSKSDHVRQKASEVLIRELKPDETKLEIGFDEETTSVIDDLRKAAEKLAISEMNSVKAGIPLNDISESIIIDVTPEEADE
ncbi:hypothetical protein [Candidatus Macondimonas diazotrophica]|jgi:hypothetical protein|uniref:Uncharacterized protein n=1 Tax=Candidatus Macondimonas diazotrophica TaxID=2305248 RepID=A0A4Z0F5L7_9GAMM|nr:hypothetical protein [Candidatus Macondimonas diazotrophica]TFZ81476.1 hypothetical protein E4680_12410 [Candidatus Macondimonas diazotrophica]